VGQLTGFDRARLLRRLADLIARAVPAVAVGPPTAFGAGTTGHGSCAGATGRAHGPWRTREILMADFMDKATEAVNQHDQQVDQGLQKAGEQVDQRTGGTHTERIDQGVDAAQQHTGSGDQS
jgi:hypothetical protein